MNSTGHDEFINLYSTYLFIDCYHSSIFTAISEDHIIVFVRQNSYEGFQIRIRSAHYLTFVQLSGSQCRFESPSLDYDFRQ